MASRRARAIEALREAGIGASVHFIPLHLHPLYAPDGLPRRPIPGGRSRLRGAISLPIWPGMSDGQVARVIDSVAAAITPR